MDEQKIQNRLKAILEHGQKFYPFIKRGLRIVGFRLKYLLRRLYTLLKIEDIRFFLLFLIHRYDPRQFNPLHVKENVYILIKAQEKYGLSATRSGQLIPLIKHKERTLFSIKNGLLLNALQKRVEKVIFYTYLTLTLELNNPFDRRLFFPFLTKKITLLKRLLKYVKTINGRNWDQGDIEYHLDIFQRNSLLQAHVIKNMELAVKRSSRPLIVQEAQAALKKGLYPILAAKGASGAYWMRGPNREVLGLFKPFDEEIKAPNNPLGPTMQGALGLRKTRWGCRVGESAHHEVGAFVVDEFFGFGIVPKTYYAEFEHTSFFLARENRFISTKANKKKWGSFQEYVGGFVSVNKLSREEIASIPLDEFQLLITLDVILGNTDRNVGNILFGDEKIAAIDHGLCFPDINETFSYWYWSFFEQGKKPFFQSIVTLLNNFPFEKLHDKLKKKCFISINSLDRMRERVVLFTAAVNAGLLPYQIEKLLEPRFLAPLKDYNSTLQEKAIAQVIFYQSELET